MPASSETHEHESEIPAMPRVERQRHKKSLRRRIREKFSTDNGQNFDSNNIAKFLTLLLLGACAVGVVMVKWPDIIATTLSKLNTFNQQADTTVISGAHDPGGTLETIATQEPIRGMQVQADQSPMAVLPAPSMQEINDKIEIAARLPTEADLRNSKEFQRIQKPNGLVWIDDTMKDVTVGVEFDERYDLYHWNPDTKQAEFTQLVVRFGFNRAKRVTFKFTGELYFEDIPARHEQIGYAKGKPTPYRYRGGASLQERTFEITPPPGADDKTISQLAYNAGRNNFPLRLTFRNPGKCRVSVTEEKWDGTTHAVIREFIIRDNKKEMPKAS